MPTSLGGTLHLAGDFSEFADEVVERRDQAVLHGEPLERDVIIALGGTGQYLAVQLIAMAVRDRRIIRMLAVDNDHTQPGQCQVVLANGEPAGIPDEAFFPLGDGHTRDEIRKNPDLARLFEGPDGTSGLLRGITAHLQHQVAMIGGHAIRPVSAIDYILSEPALRREIRALLEQAMQRVAAEADWSWDDDDIPVEQAPRRRPVLRVWILFSGVGSAGAAGSYLVPFLVKEEAAALKQPVLVYGVCTGPAVYTGVHPLVAENYVATLDDLSTASEVGIDYPLTGQNRRLISSEPGFWRIFLADDADALKRQRALADRPGQPRKDPADVVSDEIRQSFYARVARSLYLLMASTAADDLERVAVNNDALPSGVPWSAITGVLADLPMDTLRDPVALSLALGRLGSSLQPAGAHP